LSPGDRKFGVRGVLAGRVGERRRAEGTAAVRAGKIGDLGRLSRPRRTTVDADRAFGHRFGEPPSMLRETVEEHEDIDHRVLP
jgi:hypothetical protein